MTITSIQVPSTAVPAGHYAQAIVHNGLVYVSGQVPIDLVTGERRAGAIEEQAVQVLHNLRMVLEAAGSGLDRLVSVTIYVTDIDHWAAVNGEYARVLGSHRPARAIIPVGPLHHGFLIEVSGVGALRD